MKFLQYLLLIVPFLLMASNCSKKDKQPNVIKGRLMYGCVTPAANVPLMLKAGNKFVETVDGANKIYTDEYGYFEFKFQPVMKWYTLMASPQKILSQIPNQSHTDLGEVNFGASIDFIIKLQVNNPYTESDTLYIPDYQSSDPFAQKSFAGPFSNGQVLDTLIGIPFTNYPLIYEQQPDNYINYYFTPIGELRFLHFSTPFCNSTFGEAVIVIE